MVGFDEDGPNEEMEASNQQAVVRAAYRNLMDDIATNEEELTDVHNPRLRGYMETNEQLFEQVAEPQDAVLDARVIKQLSRLCRQQAEQMSSNINQFNQQEFADRLVGNMTGGEVGAAISRKKWVLLGRQVKSMFRRAPPLTYMYGALDSTPPPPKEQKAKEPRARQATRVGDLVATKATVLEEAERSENQTEQMVAYVGKCLVGYYRETKQPISFFKFVLDPDCFGSSIENMFHVSFLVKEGKAAITIDPESGLPLIAPVGRRKTGAGDSGEEVKQQVVMNICMEDWRKLKEKLDIRVAMIKKTEQQGPPRKKSAN